MKGLVLAGGTGSRLRPITYSMAKQLVPIANKPILFYGLEDLAEAGITDIGIVVSPQTGAAIAGAAGDGSRFDVDITYIVQEQPLGLAHALGEALSFIDGDDVLMYLGDNLVKQGVSDVVADFTSHRPNCQILLNETDHPEQFGVVELDREGAVRSLVEKPDDPASNLALVGVYLFDGVVAEAVNSIKPSARGEYEITDAIQYLVETGRDVRATQVSGWWKDTGHKDDLLVANELVLADLQPDLRGEVAGSEMSGAVAIGEGSRLVDCRVRGPVVIGSNVHAERCVIGPNTAVGDGVTLRDCTLTASIVLPEVAITEWQLFRSVIGTGSRLHPPAPHGVVEVTLGEGSELGTP